METLKTMYSQTYNFVYLRAKNILKKEEDIQQLVKEVYLKAAAENVEDSRLYEWLGKQVYMLGCTKFRKKKVREAELIELDQQRYTAQKNIDRETTKQVLCEVLEDLPDMYQATFYAFYYDHMTMKDISAIMGYSVGAIINRLNYVHKYLEKALDEYQEEHKVKVQFSVEVACEALCDWSVGNVLGEVSAQNIYAAICRELGVLAEDLCVEKHLGGVKCRVVKADTDELGMVCRQLEAYSVKKRIDKGQVTLFAGVGALVLLAIVGVLLMGTFAKKDNEKDKQPPIGQEESSDKDSNGEENTEDEIKPEENESSDEPNALDSEYILPKSKTEKLTRADLQGLTKEQLRLARNEIFARYGAIFGTQDLDQYFANKSWYQPKISISEFYDKVDMSLIEEANINLILQVESERE